MKINTINPVSLMMQGRFQFPSPVRLQILSVLDYGFETELVNHVNRSTTSSCLQVMSRFVHKMGNGLVLDIVISTGQKKMYVGMIPLQMGLSHQRTIKVMDLMSQVS